jgi:hypothetical protein
MSAATPAVAPGGPFLAVSHADPQSAYVATMTAPLVVAGLPLIETLRTCRVQTDTGGPPVYGRAALGQLGLSERRWTHRDRDIVTPANDFLYFCGWVNLSAGAATVEVPRAIGRYFVIELLDAYTENFANLGTRNVPPAGARYSLVGPTTPRASSAADATVVECPTDLVWLLGRVLVGEDDDVPAARAFLAGFALATPQPCPLPMSVRDWQDTGDAALDFWANLMRAVVEFPPPAYGQGGGPDFAAILGAVGLDVRAPDALSRARTRVIDGLRSAYATALAIVEAHTVSQGRKPWGYNIRLGRWRGNWLLRATTALKGLGALSAEETVYAMADFDADGVPLDGHQSYELRFAPGQLPPVDAFWSVSMYGADRYFADNPIGRYAIGDRTRGLTMEPDGGLVIPVGHARPASRVSNWLPAPAGSFYLILRFYHPHEAVLTGRYTIPPLRRVG